MGALVFWIITGIYCLALYLWSGFSLYRIALNNNVPNPWIAFVPFFQYYIIGEICEEYTLWGFRIRSLKWVLPAFCILQTVLGIVDMLTFRVLSFLVRALIALILHKFFTLFGVKRARLFAVLSLFGMLPIAIFLYWMKDMPMQMSQGAYTCPFAENPCKK